MRANVDFEFFDGPGVLALLCGFPIALEDVPIHLGDASLKGVDPPLGIGLLRSVLGVVVSPTTLSAVATTLSAVASAWVGSGRHGTSRRAHSVGRGATATHTWLREFS